MQIKPTDTVKAWVAVDEILTENAEPPANVKELCQALKNTSDVEELALLIIANRLARLQFVAVFEGGKA
jgi:hypothetical protein